MNYLLIMLTIGKVLLIGAASMLPSIGVSIIYHDEGLFPLLIGFLVTGTVGGLLQLCRPRSDQLRSRDGFAVVALSWVCMGVCGAIPLHLSGQFASWVDCLFEIVSGFTTTGSTILTDVEGLPRSIAFWRCFTHWIGGVGILVLTMALLPKIGGTALHLLRAESTGPSPDKLTPRISKSAKVLYEIYIGLTAMLAIVLLLCGMKPYDALIHAFSTAGTGGFSCYNDSIGHFDSVAVDIWISVFMVLFSLNFVLFFRMLHKEFLAPLRDTETRVFLCIVICATLLIAFDIRGLYESFASALRYAFFQAAAIISTTGFSTQDFDAWPQLSRSLLMFLMVVGGCAGSTAGGIKVIRVLILSKSAGREIRKVVHPRSVHVLRLGKIAIDEQTITAVAVFFFCYVALFSVSVLLISLNGLDFESTLTSVIACIANTGPGLGLVGPSQNFSGFSTLSKLVLIMDMLIGRLDIYPVLMFFSAAAWNKH